MRDPISDVDLMTKVQSLRVTGQQDAALLLAEERLRQALVSLDRESGTILELTCVLERLYRETGEVDRAAALRAQTIEQAKSTHGSQSRDVAAVIERIAGQMLDDEPVRWYREWPTQRYECYHAAEALMGEAVKIRLLALEPPAYYIASAVQSLKVLASIGDAGCDGKSDPRRLHQALEDVERFASNENIQASRSRLVHEVIQALKSLSKANEAALHEQDAISNLQLAIKYAEEFAGREHLEVSRCLSLLSRQFRLTRSTESAVRVAKEALRIAALYGQQSVDVAIALNALGLALIDAGDRAEGMVHLRGSFEMMEKINEWNLPFADISFCYGFELLQLERFREANQCLSVAVRIYQAQLLPEHRRRLNALVHLGRSFAGIGELDEARRIFHQTYLDAERLRKEPPYWRQDDEEDELAEEFASVCISLAAANADAGEFDESDRLLDIVSTISSELLGREVGDVRDSYEYRDEAEHAVDHANDRGWRLAHLVGPAEVMSLLRRGLNEKALSIAQWLSENELGWMGGLGIHDPAYPVAALREVVSLALLRAGDQPGASKMIDEAVARCCGENFVDEVRLANLLEVQAFVLEESGQAAEAIDRRERAQAIYRKVGHASAMT